MVVVRAKDAMDCSGDERGVLYIVDEKNIQTPLAQTEQRVRSRDERVCAASLRRVCVSRSLSRRRSTRSTCQTNDRQTRSLSCSSIPYGVVRQCE